MILETGRPEFLHYYRVDVVGWDPNDFSIDLRLVRLDGEETYELTCSLNPPEMMCEGVWKASYLGKPHRIRWRLLSEGVLTNDLVCANRLMNEADGTRR